MKKLAGTTWGCGGGGGGGGGGGELQHSETGLHRGCKTSHWVCLYNLEYQEKTKTNQTECRTRVWESSLVLWEEHQSKKWKRLQTSTFGMQTWVQSCHPRGKAEETDQSSTPPETWNQKLREKEKHQALVEGLTNGKCWSSGSRSRKVRGAQTQCLGTTEEHFRSQNWNARPCSKGNTGSRTAESAHIRDDTGSLSQEHLDLYLHIWIRKESC